MYLKAHANLPNQFNGDAVTATSRLFMPLESSEPKQRCLGGRALETAPDAVHLVVRVFGHRLPHWWAYTTAHNYAPEILRDLSRRPVER